MSSFPSVIVESMDFSAFLQQRRKYMARIATQGKVVAVGVLVTPNLVLTCEHCIPGCTGGESVDIMFEDPDAGVAAKVVVVNKVHDFIFLEIAEARACPFISQDIKDVNSGKPYILIGLSQVDGDSLDWSYYPGHISSGILQNWTVSGSSGCTFGDSGGAIWSQHGAVLGIMQCVGNSQVRGDAILNRASGQGIIKPLPIITLVCGSGAGDCILPQFNSAIPTSQLPLSIPPTKVAAFAPPPAPSKYDWINRMDLKLDPFSDESR